MGSREMSARARYPLATSAPIGTVANLRKPVAWLLVLLLLFNWTVPALAQDTGTSSTANGTQSATGSPPGSSGQGHGAPAEPPGQGSPPEGPQDTPAATRARTQADPPITTFTADAFQTDLFTGAATAEIPILLPPGTAGTAPRLALRYNSSTVDELGPRDQGQGTGRGWTLDVGGFVLRDTKLTTSPNDDTFKAVFGGVSYDLVLVDSGQNLYHTKDETFWRLQYDAQGDYWTLTTKDGTRHRFGFNPDSKAIALGQDLVTPVTYKYLLDEVTTTRDTAVRYTYAKQTATVASTGRSYDQAVYPDRITYTYHNSALVGGTAREVRFLRAPRTDWTDTSATTNVSFFERERLDAIEVLVGASLVRKYVFAFDYSIDRDPTYNWGGGATGDLILKAVTLYGSDGSSALPSLAFAYTGARLGSASNGVGGTVNYTYERIATVPVYWAGSNYEWNDNNQGCMAWRARNDAGDPRCTPPASFLGYTYVGKVDRYRVVSRSVSDGRGGSLTTTYSYTGLGLSSDGKEFRGHAAVRAVDPLGHYADTWFKQDDALKGRAYQVEARSSAGALYTQVVNTWSATNPSPGVTFVALSRADIYTCDGDATCK
ncbi:MAG TPA: hypothetical protein VGT06_06295, partial [Candidatus Methylomirabilis sp.]|nr:hypothetical protein [Candidatus Methylomirabilis sp.]